MSAPAASRRQRGFSDILLEGLAPDGGLYLPAHYPQIDAATLTRWRSLSYAELAFEILALYIDDIPHDDLRLLAQRTYSRAIFGSEQITPLTRLGDAGTGGAVHIQHLSNGPTLAFKDIAMQLLGNLFEYELARRGETLNILGATSGDTGSAAEYAMRGKRGINVFMLSPHGRMSPFQQAQMFSLQDPNIHNIAIDGVFDDCQDIVKAVSNDLAFKRRHRIGTVNSINWARLLAQVVYYFAGYFQATREQRRARQFRGAVGQFRQYLRRPCRADDGPADRAAGAGDQREQGARRILPHRPLPGARRRRDLRDLESVDGYLEGVEFRTLRLRPARPRRRRGCARCSATSWRGAANSRSAPTNSPASPAMASSPATAATPTGWRRFATPGTATGVLIDPHTADGLKVAREHLDPALPMIVLETAQPAKFAATIVEAIGREPPRPAATEGIEQLPKRCKVMPCDAAAVMAYLSPRMPECMKVIGFSAWSGSGKTTLVERLLVRLREAGQRVSVVKHAHHNFDIDHPGKDSHRHRQAGAFEVLIASNRRLAKIREFETPFEPTVHQLIAELCDCDWVLVEGFKHADLLKIEVWRESVGKRVQYPDDPYLVAIATDDAQQLPVATQLPVFDLDEVDAIADFLLGNPARYEYKPRSSFDCDEDDDGAAAVARRSAAAPA